MKLIDSNSIDLSSYIRTGDGVLWGQVAAEPQTLTEALVAQRAAIGRIRVFLGVGFSKTLAPEHGDYLSFSGMGPAGTHRRLAQAGLFDPMPFHISQIETYIRSGQIPCDVAFVQVSPPNKKGEYSFGITWDYIPAAVEKARVVIAEINHQVPWTYCPKPLVAADIDFAIEVDRPLIQVPPSSASEVDRGIATAAAKFIPDKATVQLGIGAIPDVLMSLLRDRRGLGVHSGIIGDSVAELMREGIITNEHKGIDAGITITGSLLGTDALYKFCHRNAALRLAPISYTHNAQVLAQLANFVSVNSALEVDLTGQVNAEALGGSYISGVGGQVDFVRAAMASRGGRSLIALPSTAQDGVSTRIVPQLSGPVTTARSDVDVIVTEHGAAELRGLSLSARIRAMIAIADPAHQETLEHAAHALLKQYGHG